MDGPGPGAVTCASAPVADAVGAATSMHLDAAPSRAPAGADAHAHDQPPVAAEDAPTHDPGSDPAGAAPAAAPGTALAAPFKPVAPFATKEACLDAARAYAATAHFGLRVRNSRERYVLLMCDRGGA